MKTTNGVPSWIEEMGSSPALNISTAFEIDLLVPDIKHLSALPEDERANILDSHDWIIIESLDIAIKRIDGITMSLCAYFNGEKFINPIILFNDPYMKDGKQGPQYTANCVTCFSSRDWLGKKHFKKMAGLILKHCLDFTGWINIDVAYCEGDLYYQVIRPGIFIDYGVCIAHLYGISIEDLVDGKIVEDMKPKHNFSCSFRAYDYMNNNERFFFLFPDIERHAYVTSVGEAYAIIGEGETIKKAWSAAYDRVPVKNNPDFCYRLDGKSFAFYCFTQMREARLI